MNKMSARRLTLFIMLDRYRFFNGKKGIPFLSPDQYRTAQHVRWCRIMGLAETARFVSEV